jgi:hypothetical protein
MICAHDTLPFLEWDGCRTGRNTSVRFVAFARGFQHQDARQCRRSRLRTQSFFVFFGQQERGAAMFHLRTAGFVARLLCSSAAFLHIPRARLQRRERSQRVIAGCLECP